MIMRYTYNVIWALLLFFITASPSLHAASSSSKKSTSSAFNSEKVLAVDATIIAIKRLINNRKDTKGLTLVEFAHHLYPEYEPLLLLRGQLKYNLDITPPHTKNPIGEAEFLYNLKRRALQLAKSNNIRDRHLCLIYNSMIRMFEPDNTQSIVQLMKFADEGMEMDVHRLFKKKFSQIPYYELDPKDPRYVIGNVEKTIKVFASDPWTDSWIKVKEGQIIRVQARRFWTLGQDGTFPYVDADGFDNISLKTLVDRGNSGKHDRKFQSQYRVPKFVTKKLLGKKGMKPGCLLAKIGRTVYPLGRNVTFRAESSGILFLGPFEWDSYSDNSGYLLVTIKVSDR